MKKTVIFLAVAVLIAGVSLVSAQTSTRPTKTPDGTAQEQYAGQGMGRLQGLLGKLNLTDDQKARIKNILAEQRANIKGQERLPGFFEQLNLTETQKAQIKSIRQAVASQIDAVLTPEQKAQLERLRQKAREQSRGKPGGVGRFENIKSQIDAVLTPEQRAQLEQLLEKGRDKRQKNPTGKGK